MCVRLLFVLRSFASCVAFVLCWFVWRSCAAAHRGKPKTADCGSEAKGGGLSSGGSRACNGLLTGGHLSDADNLRHAEMGGGGAADLRRASHGLMTDWTRTGDGLLMGGHLSDADNLVMSQSWGLYYENADSPSKIEGVAAGRGSMIRGEG